MSVFLGLHLQHNERCTRFVKVVGAIFRRMNNATLYPSQITGGDCRVLPTTLQPSADGTVEPAECFPPAGVFNAADQVYEERHVDGCFLAVCDSAIYVSCANPVHAIAVCPCLQVCVYVYIYFAIAMHVYSTCRNPLLFCARGSGSHTSVSLHYPLRTS